MKFHLYKVILVNAESKVRTKGIRMQDEIIRYWDMPDMKDRHDSLDVDDRKVIALERCERDISHLGRKGMFLIDMMEARRDNFPGCYTPEKGNEDLPIASGVKISQRTMALYIPGKENSYLICQYNHYGMKASSIASYLSNGTGTGTGTDIYDVESMLKKDVRERFRTAEKVVSFRMKFNITQLDESVSEAVENLADIGASLMSIINAGKDAKRNNNATFLDITIGSSKSQKQGALEYIKTIPERLFGHAGIEKLEANIKHTSQDTAEILDLLHHREVYEVEDKILKKTPGMRYDYESRKKVILGSLSYFKSHIED